MAFVRRQKVMCIKPELATFLEMNKIYTVKATRSKYVMLEECDKGWFYDNFRFVTVKN